MKKLVLKKLPGRIYKKANKRPDGTFVEHSTWTVRYKGKDHATGETDPKKAEDFLRRLIGGVTEGPKPWQKALQVVTAPSQTTRVKLSRVLDLFVADSKLRNLASAAGNEGIVRNYLKPFFGDTAVDDLTTTLLNEYKLKRIAADNKPANGTINRELGALKRALTYCKDEHTPPLLRHFPKIVMLPEAPPRKGFLSFLDYARLRHAMPAYWAPVFIIGFHVGRRRGELIQLELSDVDLDAKQPNILVPGAIAKNGEPSIIPVFGDMIPVLRAQIEMTRQRFPKCKLLFHKEGNAIHKNQAFYAEWNAACETAGVPGLLFHDLRRTACRNLIRAGNSRKEAMRITGHLTESAFERYHIVDESDVTAAVGKLAAYMEAQQSAAFQEEVPGLVS